MNTALITTTINIPTVLELYRRHGPDIAFFVAGDIKTPDFDKTKWPGNVDGFISAEDQKKLGYKCSDLIGWNTIQRRNIALLEAVKWGADVIVSIDDDNIPMSRTSYFESITSHWHHLASLSTGNGGFYRQWNESAPFSGIKVSSPTGWFDVGALLDPVAPHRGFPHDVESQTIVSHVAGAKVGAAVGICLGDPDISAVTRISRAPIVHRVSQILESGIVVDPGTHTVFNSQNTAFIRGLAPAFFMLPGVGRYDDIYASLIMQRVMRERNLHVHFGKPFVWQQRNQHNLVKDLRGEIDGMERIRVFSEWLDGTSVPGRHVESPIGMVRSIWDSLAGSELIPDQTIESALAFLEDMEGVL